MAREHARVKLSIWEDEDFRQLSGDAQRLYFVFLTSSELNYAGVTDWRPVRIAPRARDWSVARVELAAAELSAELYIVVDESTEEVLLRSFVRHDGLMEQPNLAVAMAKARTAVASPTLRGVIVHELHRLRKDKPDLKGWDRVENVLDNPSVDPSVIPSFRASVDPSDNPSVDPSVGPTPKGSDDPSVDPSPTTAPNSSSLLLTPPSGPRKRGERLPDDWKPSPEDVEWQRSRGITDADARRWLERFANYWTSKSGRDATKLDWSKTWRNWLLSEQERRPKSPGGTGRDPVTGTPKGDGWEYGMG